MTSLSSVGFDPGARVGEEMKTLPARLHGNLKHQARHYWTQIYPEVILIF